MTKKTLHSSSSRTTVVISIVAMLLVCVDSNIPVKSETIKDSKRRPRRNLPNTTDSNKAIEDKLEKISKVLSSLSNIKEKHVYIRGPSGPPGRPGLKGSRGRRGPRGRQGPEGPQGTTGRPGKGGKQGIMGPAGFKGDQGEKGATRPRGMPGLKGRTMGRPGRRGKQGIMGPAGLKGDQGEKGATGPRGMLGLKGEPGQSVSAPDLVVSPHLLIVNESQSAVLHCSSSGYPRPVIGWSKVGGSMDKNRSVMDGNGKLEILNTTMNDSGVYQCRASNILGVAQNTATLVVNFGPRLSLDSGPIYVKKGNSVTLPTCHVTGFPAPKVTWSRASGQLPRNRVIVKNGQLTLHATRRQDTGTYVCKAENLLGWSLGKTFLVVVQTPVFSVKPSNKILARPGGSISMTCRVKGDSPTVISWRRLVGDLPAGRSEVRDGTLTINNVQVSDTGMYMCTATSAGVSRAEAATKLEVRQARDCSEFYKSGVRMNGVYTVNPDGRGAFQVYCDMITDGGGWTVFQRRKDGSINFYRTWNPYKIGFGNLNGEFWLGNDYIHRLTVRTASTLRVELEDWGKTKVYAKYGSFSVGNEGSNYRLSVSSYSGSAGDSLGTHNTMAFTTTDRDNDISSANCAAAFEGAWWYDRCHASHLNGLYLGNVKNPHGIAWLKFRGYYSLKYSEMKVRPQSF